MSVQTGEVTVNAVCTESCERDYVFSPHQIVIEKLGKSVDIVTICPKDGSEIRVTGLEEVGGLQIKWSNIERSLVNGGSKVVLWRLDKEAC